MSVQDPLLLLICSLSPGQSAQAKRNLRGRKLELLKAMASTKKYLREDLGKECKEMSDSNFAVVRATLLAELTLQFGQAEEGESVREQVRELEMKATVLQKGGKVKRALTTLDKALTIARAAENWEEASRVLGLIQLIVDDPESPEELARSFSVAQPILQVQQIRTVLISARQAKGADPAVMGQRLQEIDQVLASVRQPTTQKVGLLFHHASAFVAIFRGNLGLALRNLDLAFLCLERLPGMLHDPQVMKTAIAVAMSRSSITLQLHSAVSAMQGLQAFLGLLPSGLARVRAILLQRVQWLELVHAFETKQWEMWEELHASLNVEPSKSSLMGGSRAAVYAAIASMAMARSMAGVALQWFERAFELRKFIESHQTYQVMGVVYLTAKAKLCDWDGMASHVPRVRNMLTRREMPEGIVRELGLACLTIARNPDSRASVWQGFLDELDAKASESNGGLYFDFLNLREWVLAQIK